MAQPVKVAEMFDICGECGRVLPETHSTARQTAMAIHLKDPDIPSVRQAAIKAGYSKATAGSKAGQLVRQVGTVKALSRLARRETDRATRLERQADRLLAPLDAPNALSDASPMERVQVGGSLARLAIDYRKAGITQPDGMTDEDRSLATAVRTRAALLYMNFALRSPDRAAQLVARLALASGETREVDE